MQEFPFIDLLKSALHVSGDVFTHLQEQFYYIYVCVALVQCTDLLPTGDTFEMDLLRWWVREDFPYQSYIYSKIAPEDGRKHRPKHVELI
jgi:hypothetical protein